MKDGQCSSLFLLSLVVLLLSQVYTSADALFKMTNKFDSTSRAGPKV